MRLFVYEWTCCTVEAPPSLHREGWAMLWAVLHDLRQTRRLDTVTLVHERFAHLPPGECHRVRSAAEENTWFDDLAGSADATLLIAPETGGVLLQKAQRVRDLGGRLLGPSPAAIQLTTDKALVAAAWQRAGVPTPAAQPLNASSPPRFPCVLKPRDGAGSQATYLVADQTQLQHCAQLARAELPSSEFFVQDFAAGLTASVALLLGAGRCLPLAPGAQLLSDDGRFHYQGGEIPLPTPLTARAVTLARRAVAAVPELTTGYVGVDLVLGDAVDGSRDVALEINPRLTTSYIGLRMLTRDNLADAMLRLADGAMVAGPRWIEQRVRFRADGSVEVWPTAATAMLRG